MQLVRSCSNLPTILAFLSWHPQHFASVQSFLQYANDGRENIDFDIKDIIQEDDLLTDIKTQLIDMADELAKIVYFVTTEPYRETVL